MVCRFIMPATRDLQPSDLSEFDFELPPEFIAQEPLAERSASRMLAVDRSSGSFSDRKFTDFSEFIRPGDIVVINDTKVFPARLIGHTSSGARVEIFLIAPAGDYRWHALAKPQRRLSAGKRILFAPDIEAVVDEIRDGGKIVIDFSTIAPRGLDEAIDSIGETPLPPYIRRPQPIDEDRDRYQTVYARERGAIAAPTAGLHFTESTFASLKDAGATLVPVTLHVGYGTFEPVRVDRLSDHRVMPETFAISDESAETLESARRARRRIVAIGTTTTRALESNLHDNGCFAAATGEARLTITPGYRFAAVSALLTNFHLPRSSLLVLVSTFGGHKLIMDAYRHAVASRYRFYSYGDCMFIS
jgi:S-adenosylmethionine:tRNA ribosyltransferase-isomerase